MSEFLQSETYKAIPEARQRQDSTQDQLSDLAFVATKLGMYDAADYLRRAIVVPTPSLHAKREINF